MSTDGENLAIELTHDEALVVFDFLTRFSDTDQLQIEDQAEQRALRNLQCVFEKALVEIFDPQLPELIEAAKNRLRDSSDAT
ncbi:MAG: hypothetical protein AAGC44_12750 [Planctomycetota bacterium]